MILEFKVNRVKEDSRDFLECLELLVPVDLKEIADFPETRDRLEWEVWDLLALWVRLDCLDPRALVKLDLKENVERLENQAKEVYQVVLVLWVLLGTVNSVMDLQLKLRFKPTKKVLRYFKNVFIMCSL